MKILVTGGAGYIGSILVPTLLSLNNEITVIDNFMYKQSSLNQICFNKNFKIINGDIRDSNLMREQIAANDVVIPLAAIAAAAWSCVEKMLHDDHLTSAPKSMRVSINTAVCIVICMQPMILAPLSGCSSR